MNAAQPITDLQRMQVFDALCEGLGKRPFESLEKAAKRCLRCTPPPSLRVRLAAHIVIGRSRRMKGRPAEAPWTRLARAARVLEGGR